MKKIYLVLIISIISFSSYSNSESENNLIYGYGGGDHKIIQLLNAMDNLMENFVSYLDAETNLLEKYFSESKSIFGDNITMIKQSFESLNNNNVEKESSFKCLFKINDEKYIYNHTISESKTVSTSISLRSSSGSIINYNSNDKGTTAIYDNFMINRIYSELVNKINAKGINVNADNHRFLTVLSIDKDILIRNLSE